MNERWRSVVGYEGLYEVSDQGRVRGLIRGKVMRPKRSTHTPPRLTVELYRAGMGQWKNVHCLVLEAFVGPRPLRHEGCHNDGDPANNALINLRWDTAKANAADRRTHGTLLCGEKHPQARVTRGCVDRMFDMRRAGCRVQAIADWFGMSRPQTGQILSGKQWAM